MTRRGRASLCLLFGVAVALPVVAESLPGVWHIDDDLPLLVSGDEERHHVSFDALLRHVRSRVPDADEIYLATLYRRYVEACRAEGVSLIAALAQMIHETDFLRFSGSVRAVQYNYAGIGAIAAGHPGHTFADMQRGVVAHVQHIVAYATTRLPTGELVDPRFHLVRRGSATTVRELTGRWATDPDYGPKVLSHIAALRRAER